MEGHASVVELNVIVYVLDAEAERSIVPELVFENTSPVGEELNAWERKLAKGHFGNALR